MSRGRDLLRLRVWLAGGDGERESRALPGRGSSQVHLTPMFDIFISASLTPGQRRPFEL
jgi:hypothetical protein